jgi:16S rRNA U1498 N3-methylase RsmE
MEEFDCFYSLGAKGVSLGPRILRAETAAIAALTLIMSFMECGR